jgi:hypothetical protein
VYCHARSPKTSQRIREDEEKTKEKAKEKTKEKTKDKTRLAQDSPKKTTRHPQARQSLDKTRQDKTRQDKTRQDKTRQDKTRQEQDKTRQDETRQDKTRQDKTRQDKTRQDKTGQDRTKQEKTRQEKKRRKDETSTRKSQDNHYHNSRPSHGRIGQDAPAMRNRWSEHDINRAVSIVHYNVINLRWTTTRQR